MVISTDDYIKNSKNHGLLDPWSFYIQVVIQQL